MTDAKIDLVQNEPVSEFINNSQWDLFFEFDSQLPEPGSARALVHDLAMPRSQIVMHRHAHADDAKSQIAVTITDQPHSQSSVMSNRFIRLFVPIR